MTQWRGCGTALVTPFTPGGDLDLPALTKLVEWQIAEEIDLLVPCGTTGETPTLTDAERERVVATVVEVAAGRVPVMAGATSNDTARAADEARRMCRLGVSQVLSACPYYNRPTQEGLYRHFMTVAEACSVPLVVYNIPGRTGVNMTPHTTLRLAEHERITGVKESSGDLQQIAEIIAGRPEGFAVLAGDDWIALPVIAMGGDGIVSVASNAVPGAMRAMVHMALDDAVAPARELHYRLLPLMRALFAETSPAPIKAALHLMRRIENVVRLPLVPASPATIALLRQALANAGATSLRHG